MNYFHYKDKILCEKNLKTSEGENQNNHTELCCFFPISNDYDIILLDNVLIKGRGIATLVIKLFWQIVEENITIHADRLKRHLTRYEAVEVKII